MIGSLRGIKMNNTTEMPPHITCPECKEEGKRIIHTAVVHDLPDTLPTGVVEQDLLDGTARLCVDGDWTWELLNHDGTSKFEWPDSFSSQNEASEHIWDLMTDGDTGEQESGT